MTAEFDPYRKWLGIPPEEQPPHHYRLLGIALFEDDPDVIENAADRQMTHVRKFQAGRHGSLSQQILNELSLAKLCLLHAEKKQAYDRDLRRRLPPDSPPQANIPSAEPPPMEPPRAEPPVAVPPGSLGAEPTGEEKQDEGSSVTRELSTSAAIPGSPLVAVPTQTLDPGSNQAEESEQNSSGEDEPKWTHLATTGNAGASRRRRSHGKKLPLGLILSVLTILAVVVLYLIVSSLVK